MGQFLRRSAATNPCEPEIVRAADRYHIPVGILYAVGLTETGKKGSLQPNALNIEGKAVFPASRSAAIAAFEEARRGGAKLIDLGCMQINHHYHSGHFRSLGDMLDPKQNVDYAARFLLTLKQPPRHLVDGRRALPCRSRQQSGAEAICLPRHRQHGGDRLRPMDRQRARLLQPIAAGANRAHSARTGFGMIVKLSLTPKKLATRNDGYAGFPASVTS